MLSKGETLGRRPIRGTAAEVWDPGKGCELWGEQEDTPISTHLML